MAKGDKKKKLNRTTAEVSLTEVTEDISTSGQALDPPAEQEHHTVITQPAEEPENTEEPEILHIPVLSNIIVQRYEGERCGEVFNGEGVAYFEGGHVYKGSFADGFMQGHGEYTWLDGLKYEGEFALNAPMGHGVYTFLDGSTYEGEVYNSLRHGTGTYKCAKTSTIYRGQWHQGKRHGKGTIYYNPDVTSWYDGDWKDNQIEGTGIRCYPSGNIYQGQWKNNVRHGEGTMKWIQLGQQYSGQWHGHGTHTWFLRRVPGSQYPLRNEYKGEFDQGLRHGQGTFFYASGAVYSGSWKHNRKHGQGKFVFKNGCSYEGAFIDDRMADLGAFSCDGANSGPDLSPMKTCSPPPLNSDLPKKRENYSSTSLLGEDITLDIGILFNQMSKVQRDQELRQVEFTLLRHVTLLRTLYSLYSRLGQDPSPDNTFLLSRLQFWRFLKDSNIHLHGITLAQMDRLIDEDISPDEVHSPFGTILLRKWISYIVIVAYHIYHRDFESSNSVVADCFTKLMTHIIPNGKNVKGPLFCHPCRAVIGRNYIDRCWEIYQAFSKANSAAFSDKTMTARQFIWMLKDFGLLDCKLTSARVLEILSLENPVIYNPTHSNLDLEITFLEFFEALLGCAEVKKTHLVKTAEHSQSELSDPDETIRTSTNEMKASPFPSQLASPQYESVVESLNSFSSSATSVKSLEAVKSKDTTLSAPTEELQKSSEDMGNDQAGCKMELNKDTIDCAYVTEVSQQPINTEVAGVAGPEGELEDWIHTIHQFFIHTFFPAYEQNLLLKDEMQDEQLRQITKNRIALEKAKEDARLREQQEAENKETFKEDSLEAERNVDIPDCESSHSPPALTSSVTSTSSVAQTQSATKKKQEKQSKKKKK
ncbi:radial spoke head 10 homolog B isoform X2 [Trichomycterus rosablanca]|uniref:radial spoke head 10 homolog B isoform X2 n=1 Tax=Trichomycterus rosablanca TaxID=2290929 RepID=UPI002F3512EC